MRTTHQFDISRATRVKDLETSRADVLADETLHTDEKEELLEFIRQKMCRLNAEAVGEQKPRW